MTLLDAMTLAEYAQKLQASIYAQIQSVGLTGVKTCWSGENVFEIEYDGLVLRFRCFGGDDRHCCIVDMIQSGRRPETMQLRNRKNDSIKNPKFVNALGAVFTIAELTGG
jgi:hypothetical protein